MKYAQIKDGDCISIPFNTRHRMCCCDCGLIHDIVYDVKRKSILLFPIRNKRATAAKRKPYAYYYKQFEAWKEAMETMKAKKVKVMVKKGKGKKAAC